ncbi:Peptide deformylase 1B, chloroplastic [Orobanche minor]
MKDRLGEQITHTVCGLVQLASTLTRSLTRFAPLSTLPSAVSSPHPARRSFSSMDNEAAVASPADLLFKAPLEVVKYPDPILRAKNKRVNMFDESLKRLVHEMFDVMYRNKVLKTKASKSYHDLVTKQHNLWKSIIEYEMIDDQAKRIGGGSGKVLAAEKKNNALALMILMSDLLLFNDAQQSECEKLVGFLFHRTDGIGLSAPQVGINVELMVFNLVGERGEGEEIVLINPRIKRYSSKIVPFNEGCLSFPGIYGDVQRPDALQVDAQDIAGASFEVNLTGLSARVFQHEYDHLQMGMLIRVSSVQYILGLTTRIIPNVQSNYKGKPITSSVSLEETTPMNVVPLEETTSMNAQLFTNYKGILFIDRMSDEVLDGIRAELQARVILTSFTMALEKKYEETTGLPSPETIDARRKKKAVGFGKA